MKFKINISSKLLFQNFFEGIPKIKLLKQLFISEASQLLKKYLIYISLHILNVTKKI